MYWRGKKEREVDFILKQGLPKPVAVEVKYQTKITSRYLYGVIDLKKITDSPTAIVLSRETLEVRGNVTIIPIWLFLLIA